ncbi:hypothetical protein LCGC14_2031710 [marine sediment metagenome]|uniref:Uncharacterized protein n=1 Tax=marine sediment metagenome TaxID=412755 RepID=A0A0F9EUL6_9ZZZZ
MTLRNVTDKEYARMLKEPPPVIHGDPTKPRTTPQQIRVKGAHWKNSVYFDMHSDIPPKDGPLDEADMKLLHNMRRKGRIHGPIFRRLAERLAKHGHDAP